MNKGSLEDLENAIRAVCEFKQRTPYYYLEWSTKKGLQESYATICAQLIDRVVRCLEHLFKESGSSLGKIRKCSGTIYFPREPWIGFFNKGEKATDGVYPVIVFSEDGRYVYVGCTASLETSQPHFQEEFCGDVKPENHNGLLAEGSIRIDVKALSGQDIINAIDRAHSVWMRYRERYPRRIVSTEVVRKVIGADLEQNLREILRKHLSFFELDGESNYDVDQLFRWWQSAGKAKLFKSVHVQTIGGNDRSDDSFGQLADVIAEEEIRKWWKGKPSRDKWYRVKKARTDEEQWYEREEVKDLHDWLKQLNQLKRKFPDRVWVFRGQADAYWKLETGLGLRVFSDGNQTVDIEAVVAYEHETMDAFRREISKTPEYCHFDGVDLLSLMQHYGSKTRLLDFSLSPLVALYMALDQRDNYILQAQLYNDYHGTPEVDFDSETVVWMVEAKQFAYPGFVRDLQVGFAADEQISCDSIKWLKDNASNGSLPWWAAKEMFHQDATRILKAERPLPYQPGIDVVFPRMNSARISSQEGLFLMPRRMDCTFHRNLEAATERAKKYGAGFIMPKKYVFSKGLRGKLRELLQSLYVTSKMIYPDLMGLAQSLNLKVDFRKKGL